MPTPILRNNVGSAIAVTTTVAIANNAYANSADKLRIQNTGNALLADFRLTGAVFAAAPVTGSVQLVAVGRDFAGNAGPAPSASMIGKVYSFSPQPTTGNVSTGWIMGCDSVPLAPDTDYWLYNNGTGQQIALGCTLTAQPWSPGS